jgi:hypothetical protein
MDDFTFSVTGYTGFEDEILRIRNANRSIAQTRNYLDWRYAKSADAPDPVVFWIKSASGDTVGMASMIFRPYLLNGRPLHLGAIGDIALDSSLRGKGLGKGLMLYIREYLDRNMPDQAAFVIPNEAAQRSLVAADWETGGKLFPYALVRDPGEKLERMLKSSFLARLAGLPVKTLFSLAAKLQVKRGYEIKFVDGPDDSFETLWDTIPKDDMVISDRGAGALTWRYFVHPHKKFAIAKFMKEGDLAGYLIYECSPADGSCQIYDMIVRDRSDLLCMLALFLLRPDELGNPGIVRMSLNNGHPFSANLWKLGFIRREEQATFYIHRPAGFPHQGPLNWFMTLGDKDI